MEGTMDTTALSNRAPFKAHPCFSDVVNDNIIRSEIEGGVYLRDLSPGSVLSIQTKNRVYEMVILEDGAALISGHPEFCPEPTEVQIQGSTWGGSMLKTRFLGRGMHLEFEHPLYRKILTSRILDIRAR
jgi:hypothetical protein